MNLYIKNILVAVKSCNIAIKVKNVDVLLNPELYQTTQDI